MAMTGPAKTQWAGVASVTLLVGETRTAFHVHESILFEASTFFKAAFTSRFRESSDRTMPLPEDDVSIFEVFVNWLYRQRFDMQDPSEVADNFMLPAQLFVLADHYDVPDLKSCVLTEMFDGIKHAMGLPTFEAIAYAYENTPPSAWIRTLFADGLVFGFELCYFQDPSVREWLQTHPDVSTDLVLSFAKHKLTQVNPFEDWTSERYLKMLQEHGK